MNLVAEIAYEQYCSALFIRDPWTSEFTDNIEIIQATLNDVTVNSYYKPSNQPLDFRSNTTDTPLSVIIGGDHGGSVLVAISASNQVLATT